MDMGASCAVLPPRTRILCAVCGSAAAILTWFVSKEWSLVMMIIAAITACFLRHSKPFIRVFRVVFIGYALAVLAFFIFYEHDRVFLFPSLWDWYTWRSFARKHLPFLAALPLLFAPYLVYIWGLWDGKLQRTPVWSTIGWLSGAVIVGIFFGEILGPMGSSSSRFSLLLKFGRMRGAIIGLWFGVAVDAYVHRNQSEAGSRLGAATMLKLALLITFTVAMLGLEWSWRHSLLR